MLLSRNSHSEVNGTISGSFEFFLKAHTAREIIDEANAIMRTHDILCEEQGFDPESIIPLALREVIQKHTILPSKYMRKFRTFSAVRSSSSDPEANQQVAHQSR